MTATLPARWYWDPDLYARERTAIFAREWQVLGAAEQVAATGDCLSGDIAGWPVVAVRGDDGALRAFHNVCRHRASLVVRDRTASCAALTCPYHGWTYGLDGSLKRARDFGDDDVDLPLHPIAVDAWRGLVFVSLAADAPPLLESLGGFAAECDGFELESFRLVAEVSHVLRCNWKTYADNYGEGYHIPFVHPELYRQIDGRAYVVDVFDRWTRHSARMRDIGSPAAGVWLWRFPNLALNVYANGMNVERFTPVDATTTRIDYTYFFRDGEVDDDAVKLSTELLAEDADICEVVQRNLEAGVYDTGVLSPRHEGGLALLQRLVREALEA